MKCSRSILILLSVIPSLIELSATAQDFDWQPQPEKAAVMLVQAHPDDEAIHFGGVIPYYGVCRRLPVIVVAMTSGGEGCLGPQHIAYDACGALREQEMRCSIWKSGLRNEPIFARFRDCCEKGSVDASWAAWGGRDKAVGYLTQLIRKFRPDVVLAHDLIHGEYGHSNHIAAGIATVEAFEAAGDPTRFPEQLDSVKTWQPKKCYVHLFSGKSLTHRWDMESEEIEGKTPLQVTYEGLRCYVTQGNQRVRSDPSAWGLYATTVGPDSIAKEDFLENINLSQYGQANLTKRELNKQTPSRAQDIANDRLQTQRARATRKKVSAVVFAIFPKWFLSLLSHAGDLSTLAAATVIMFASGLLRRRSKPIRAATVLAAALTLTGVVVGSLKWLANRGADGVFYGFWVGERGEMFPSGHTAMVFAACVVIGAVWRKARWPAWAIAAGVALSRATLAHFVSDVVAGALIGLLVGRLLTDWAAKKGFLTLDVDARGKRSPAPGTPGPHG